MTRENAPHVQVRLATAGEADLIASVLYQSFLEYEPAYTPPAFAATTPTPDQIRSRFDQGPAWIALKVDRVVGTVSAVVRGEGLYIRSMAILPEARGQGIGKLLLQQAERFAREQRCTFMFLSTTPFLLRAIQLYEQIGFRRSAQGPRDLFGTPLFTMEKTLSPAPGTME